MALDKNSIRVVFAGLAVLLAIFGLGVFNDAQTQLSAATIASMLIASIVIAIELSLKQFTNFSKQREFSFVQFLGLGLVLVLVGFSLYSLPFVNQTPPEWLSSITSFAVGISSLYILWEAFTA